LGSNLDLWNIHAGSELDLFWQQHGKNWGAEFKYADAPRLTKSMNIVLNDLNLEHPWVICHRKETYQLSNGITVLPLIDFFPA
jgi:predicted AAA+ superfamily ATPase